MSFAIPQGFRFAGVHCGVKRSAKLDLSLVVSDRPAIAAGVYTQNRVFAAPVALNRSRTPSADVRAVVVNSGNANACTGQRGLRDAEEMARATAAACGAAEKQVLVLSTGIIGTFLPMDKISAGIRAAAGSLAAGEEGLLSAARGMLTTDTTHKVSTRKLVVAGRALAVCGMAKGAAMIGPNMATMLAVIVTDAALDVAAAQGALREVVDESFNCISVEGHMSTNDSVLLLANGAAGAPPLAGKDLIAFREALGGICGELARAIAADGEGATHFVTLEVTGCATPQAARQIARTVANSPLLKTAVAGGDPNWGRVVSAAGYAGIEFDPAKVSVSINGFPLYANSTPIEFDAARVSASIRDNRDTQIAINFAEGTAAARFWTTDLTAEYIRLNTDYHT